MGCGPKVTKIGLPYVQVFQDRYRRTRRYFRKPGHPRVPLPGIPGSPEFIDAYQRALDSAPKQRLEIGEGRTEPGSMSALAAAYYQSSNWKRLRPESQRTYRNIIERLRTEFGTAPIVRIERKHIRAMLDARADKPAAARNFLKVMRALLSFAAEREMIPADPTIGIKSPRYRTRGYPTWSEDEIGRFYQKWPPGSRARLALDLLLYTGQRRSDIVRMGWPAYRGDRITVVQQKTGAALDIPAHPVLRDTLANTPRTNLTFLITAYGKPFTAPGFTNWFRECVVAAGLPPHRSAHGLRKSAARRLAEAGCTAHEIMAITGHKTLSEVDIYTRAANQKDLADAAIARLNKLNSKV